MLTYHQLRAHCAQLLPIETIKWGGDMCRAGRRRHAISENHSNYTPNSATLHQHWRYHWIQQPIGYNAERKNTRCKSKRCKLHSTANHSTATPVLKPLPEILHQILTLQYNQKVFFYKLYCLIIPSFWLSGWAAVLRALCHVQTQ